MMFSFHFVVLLFLLVSLGSVAQPGSAPTDSLYQAYLDGQPAFSMFGDSYFVTGSSLREAPSREAADGKFQIGLKQRITNKPLPWNTYLFITYRHLAVWDIYQKSLPIVDHVLNPSIGLAKVFLNEDQEVDRYFFLHFEHESNGRAGDTSRAWNRFTLDYLEPIGDHWQLRASAWLPVGDLSGNPDLLKYRGYFDLGAGYRPSERWILEGEFSKAFTSDWRGHVQLGLNYKVSKVRNQFIYLQYYGGYVENLLEYDQNVSMLRVGFIFKDLFANF